MDQARFLDDVQIGFDLNIVICIMSLSLDAFIGQIIGT